MRWHFSPLPGDQVEAEVTQRDQFDNDDVDISETIVREAIQNSLDAAVDDPCHVHVSFQWIRREHGVSPEFFESLFDGHRDHAKAAGISYSELNFEQPTALVIEDSGTTGLTGQTSSIDDSNFSDFWRRHGKSHKSGKSRGRWGLGKLVYSSTSRAGVFFGATQRAEDSVVHIMGQTVLNLRSYQGKRYPPHAFFADIEETRDADNLNTRIPVPVKDAKFVQKFMDNFSLERSGRPGLSVVIPFPQADISPDRMIEVAIANYFYPLITGQLELSFGDVKIKAGNVRQLAKQYAAQRFDQIDVLFDFIEQVYKAEQTDLLQLKPSWSDDRKLDADDFDPATLEAIRKKFSSGELVGLYLPLVIKPKVGAELDSGFSVYIKRPENLVRGLDLYVRGGLTLPKEAKMGDRHALGAMIAEQEHICAFLGDAENAAHTRWTTRTEKLTKNYRSTQATITAVKKSVIQLYDLLAEVTEEVDEDALHDFFWHDEPEEGPKRKRREKPKPPLSVPTIVRRDPLIRLTQVSGGFTLASTEAFTEEDLPREIKVKMAYAVPTGNAFKKYSPHDFRFGRKGQIRCSGTVENFNISVKQNVLDLEITKLPFKVTVEGFDQNRDLKVDAR